MHRPTVTHIRLTIHNADEDYPFVTYSTPYYVDDDHGDPAETLFNCAMHDGYGPGTRWVWDFVEV